MCIITKNTQITIHEKKNEEYEMYLYKLKKIKMYNLEGGLNFCGGQKRKEIIKRHNWKKSSMDVCWTSSHDIEPGLQVKIPKR